MAVINSPRIRRIWARRTEQELWPIFDTAWYVETYPDLAGADPVAHFSSIGWAEGRKPHPLFDTDWYLATYPDVDASGQNPFTHYLTIGWREGRCPNPLFDTRWYLDANPDVREADMDPLTHYILSGAAEGRKPNPVFDPDFYLKACANNQDAKKNPLAHYLTYGWRQGLSPNALFDPDWYRKIAGLPENVEPLAHFLSEARPRSPHPLFDAEWYFAQNEDVAGAGQNPLVHYLEAGKWERRNPHPLFDAVWYLEAYPDVEKAGIDPFEHFVSSGAFELRRPSGAFHTDWYAAQYPEAVKSGMNLLEYYVRYGEKLGHRPTAFEANAADIPAARNREPRQLESADASDARKGQSRPTPPLKPAPNSGQVVEASADELGQLHFPPFTRGDGRRLASIRTNRQHIWYGGEIVDEFLDGLQSAPALPDMRSLLVIGHDFTLNTGVLRSISHYLNALAHQGGVEMTSVEPVRGADASVVQHEIETHDFVIVNSLPFFFDNPNAFDILKKFAHGKCAVYLHETDFVFDKLERERPQEYAEFEAHAADLAFLTVSAQQEEMLERRFGAVRVHRVAETSPVVRPERGDVEVRIPADKPLTIVMAGTLQARKGVSLFSEVADHAAKAGLPWKFKWAGGEVGLSKGLYRSDNVDFMGHLDGAQMKDLLDAADVFFLSSEDDPFPLACLEALQKQKRVVAYSRTGTAEVLTKISGCSVYNQHNADEAFRALKEAVASPLDLTALRDVNDRYSLSGFVRAMSEAISGIRQIDSESQAPRWTSGYRVGIVLHLFYHDLWNEMAGFLENTRHVAPDLYVSLTTDKPREELDRMRARILRRWPSATVLEVPNCGMDVGPFVATANHIKAAGKEYDVLLKLHSKKSLAASGEAEGRKWRLELLHSLAHSPTDVDRILSIFAEHDSVGMVGSRGMLIEKSSRDVTAGHDVNAPNMNYLADRMGLSDRSQRFFRGTMFWARAEDVLDPITNAGLSIEDFEAGHQSDNSRAHAMERLFACMVRTAGKKLYAFDPEMPKPVSFLKDRHLGEDVYIIAAGASAGFLAPTFFEGKTVIGVNRVFVRFPCTYAISKEYANGEYEQELLATTAIPVTAKWDSGNIRQGKMRKNTRICRSPRYYFYDHLENARETVDTSVIHRDSDKLVVSYSTITTAMHLAAYMGARNIILVGHDCGLLDGQAVFEGYYKDMSVSPWASSEEYADWLAQIEEQTLIVKARLQKEFHCNILSLNPFVNFGLEGRVYSRTGK